MHAFLHLHDFIFHNNRKPIVNTIDPLENLFINQPVSIINNYYEYNLTAAVMNLLCRCVVY